ncbi:VOC family protein [Novosphingobium sp. PP1Y]|uniref:VOC family protein n=1 Tax=Novosphingobium sp. PP1Y TaxID=702113 RepID=UPI00020EF35B|nr:VOC family protein [Novosphingobium sp. PP1Y]CCA93998.1 glyoxalase/bleomycin resistance protein/dioxygenase [Novosphingobium sp. PP1Y]
MALSLHHINISTPNLQRMQEFYEKAFGFEPVFVHNLEDYQEEAERVIGVKDAVCTTVTMKGGNVYIELFQWSNPVGKRLEPLRPYDYGYTHLCFNVDDIDAEFERLSGLGLPFVHGSPTKTVFDGKTYGSVYGRDPDGNLIEIMQSPSDSDMSLNRCEALALG